MRAWHWLLEDAVARVRDREGVVDGTRRLHDDLALVHDVRDELDRIPREPRVVGDRVTKAVRTLECRQ